MKKSMINRQHKIMTKKEKNRKEKSYKKIKNEKKTSTERKRITFFKKGGEK